MQITFSGNLILMQLLNDSSHVPDEEFPLEYHLPSYL